MKRVFLSGYWATNLGDDLFVKVLCERYKQLNFSLETTKKHGKVYEKIDNLHVYNKRENLFVYIKNKLIDNVRSTSNYFKFSRDIPIYIELGGSIFMMPKNEKDKRIIKKRLAIRDVAQKYLVMGSNFGPYYNEEQVEEYASFFDKLDGVVFRDQESMQLFDRLNNIEYGADIVFNLDVESLKKEENKKVIVSVIDLSDKTQPEHTMNYERFLLKSIIELSNEGLEIVLMSFSEQQGDLLAAKRIIKELPEKYKSNVEIFNHNDIEKSLAVVSSAKAIIATRFHAMILGWIFQKPTYVISYSSKTGNVIKDIFPEQNFIETSSISSETSAISLADFSIIPESVLAQARESAEKQFKYLDILCY